MTRTTPHAAQAVAAFNLPVDVLAEIDRRAKQELIARAAWIRRAVIRALRAEQEPAGPVRPTRQRLGEPA